MKPKKPRWHWVRVEMGALLRNRFAFMIPHHLQLRRVDFIEANVMFRGWDHNERALFTPNVAAVVTVWNNSARNGEDAFGGITRTQFLEEYVKPAWEIDREEREAAA